MTENILQRIAKGDESAIEECLSSFGALVWSLVRRFCNSQDAEDAVQEIFIEIWKNADKYDPSKSSPATFVSLIARRRLIDRLRKKSRALDTVPIDGEPSSPVEVFGDQMEIADEVAKTKTYLKQLKPEEQKVIELSVYQHLPQSKIAEILELPLGTVKTHARRGMLRLRELLGIESLAGEIS